MPWASEQRAVVLRQFKDTGNVGRKGGSTSKALHGVSQNVGSLLPLLSVQPTPSLNHGSEFEQSFQPFGFQLSACSNKSPALSPPFNLSKLSTIC